MTMRMGVRIQYCGHDASFVADVYDFGDTVAIHKGSPLDLATVDRPAGACDFLLTDFPTGGMWKPSIGVFVVPSTQLRPITIEDTL